MISPVLRFKKKKELTCGKLKTLHSASQAIKFIDIVKLENFCY